jgi:hypothetical protein
VLSRFIHEMGKTCRRRAVPYLGDFGAFLPFLVPLKPRCRRQQPGAAIKAF